MTPELETSAEVHKTGHRWIDRTVAGCALVVSATSLFVAIRHGHTMERMAEANARLVAANSWPMLQRYVSTRDPKGGEFALSWWVVNNGVGPAKVEEFEVFYKGQAMRTVRDLLRACCLLEQDASNDVTLQTSDIQGNVLRAGEIRTLFMTQPTPAAAAIVRRWEASYHDVTIHACYCSVFDECWVSSLNTLHPKEVKQCPVSATPFGSPD
jgi:hypothetical protein